MKKVAGISSNRRVAMGLLFYPRGGSAQVVRYLSRALQGHGWECRVASGSLGRRGEETDAKTFFGREDVTVADFTEALRMYLDGLDPMTAPVPFQPSFEDRTGVPDRVFTSLSPALHDRQVTAWRRVLRSGDWADGASVFHLNHVTPLHEAVAAEWPEGRVVTHLHGTGLKMLDRLERATSGDASMDSTRAAVVDSTGEEPLGRRSEEDDAVARRRYSEYWRGIMRRSAKRSDKLIAISPHDRDEALRLLGVDDANIVTIPNGVDTDLFRPLRLSSEERMGLLRRWLVDDPRGWDESGKVGSIAYTREDLARFLDPSTGQTRKALIFVGRFLEFKRVPLLIRAYALAQQRARDFPPLIVWGGSPGEWEGEHPHTVARAVGARDVFFIGWRPHSELPRGFACAEAMVAPSTDEPFGQVFLEAMSCGLPVVATNTGGPPTFVNTVSGKPSGWLVEADDVEALSRVLVEVASSAEERRMRGENGLAHVRADYSWQLSLADKFIALYEQMCSSRLGTPGSL